MTNPFNAKEVPLDGAGTVVTDDNTAPMLPACDDGDDNITWFQRISIVCSDWTRVMVGNT